MSVSRRNLLALFAATALTPFLPTPLAHTAGIRRMAEIMAASTPPDRKWFVLTDDGPLEFPVFEEAQALHFRQMLFLGSSTMWASHGR